jgi:broad specificity phosphatase PhoE
MAPSIDSPLTARGRAQAAATAAGLQHEPAVRIYSAATARALETASIIALPLNLEVIPLESLNEVEIGLDADPLDPLTRAASAEALRSWVVDQNLDISFVGGESGHFVVRRTTDTLRAIAAAHPGETVIIVGHVASLTAALSALCDLHTEVWGHPLPHAQPFTVTTTLWQCENWPTQIVGGAV